MDSSSTIELINTVTAATVRLVVVVYHVISWLYDCIEFFSSSATGNNTVPAATG